jgi:exopolyphosphatase/guanosine-5'-triphosphate,3'-diphosphate pyrophosphatase
MAGAPPGSGPLVVGAVDIGSNSIKLTVGRRDSSGVAEILETAIDTVRLGSGLGATGRLADDRIDAALAALSTFGQMARAHGATHLVGVATEATRRAANGEAVLRRVREETGWSVEVIDGNREAELTFRGVASQADVSGVVVVADIGGGSTELIVANDGEVVDARSLPIGSGSLTDRYLPSDPPTAGELDCAAESVSAQLRTWTVIRDSQVRLIVVGGTAEHLARMNGGGQHVAIAAVERALETCLSTPSTELAARLAIPEARARVLPADIAVIRALMARLAVAEMEVAASGIRTGLVHETLERLAGAGSKKATRIWLDAYRFEIMRPTWHTARRCGQKLPGNGRRYGRRFPRRLRARTSMPSIRFESHRAGCGRQWMLPPTAFLPHGIGPCTRQRSASRDPLETSGTVM